MDKDFRYEIRGSRGILHCPFCKQPVCVAIVKNKKDDGHNWQIYCPRCDVTALGDKAEAIYFCEDCGTPVVPVATDSDTLHFYCVLCEAFHRLNELYQEGICPTCRRCHEPGHCPPHHRSDN